MQQGLTTQQIQAAQVRFEQGKAPVVLGDEPRATSLRDNLRHRRAILDDIHQAAELGDETETLRLALKLATLRHYSEHLHLVQKAS